MKIFVQIASYRDKELLPTIEHCIKRAKNPESISFGICWQKEDTDNSIEKYYCDNRFSIVAVPYFKSKGTCWARHITNQLLRDEEFSLQIDSHTRFVENWDEKIIRLWEEIKDDKAILTSYPPQYEPNQEEKLWKQDPQMCNVYSFKDGLTEQRPTSLPKNTIKPMKAVHVAAGFIFGPSSYVRDVPYDPEFYFLGEETALTVRLFTHGYNLYHPHEIFVYHYYERKEQPKHWVDDKQWINFSKIAKERIECLLGRSNLHDLGSYKLGSVRSLKEFQDYSGIDYTRKIIHLDTVNGLEPPVDISDIFKWSYERKKYNKIIQWNFNKVEKCSDPRFWAVIFKDQNDTEIYREDLKYSEYRDIIEGNITQRQFNFEYYHPGQRPTTFIIWPYSESKKWLNYAKWNL